MLKNELIKRSPIRILDSYTPFEKGKLGLLVASQGVGKTSALIHIAIDRLLQGKPVVHASFSGKAEKVLEYYEEIFVEISKQKNLEKALDVHDEIAKNRMVFTFEPGTAMAHVVDTFADAMDKGKVGVDTIILDEGDFDQISAADLRLLMSFSESHSVAIWMSLSWEKGDPFPPAVEAIKESLAALLYLKPSKDNQIHLQVLNEKGKKEQDTHLILDPKTLLLKKD